MFIFPAVMLNFRAVCDLSIFPNDLVSIDKGQLFA